MRNDTSAQDDPDADSTSSGHSRIALKCPGRCSPTLTAAGCDELEHQCRLARLHTMALAVLANSLRDSVPRAVGFVRLSLGLSRGCLLHEHPVVPLCCHARMSKAQDLPEPACSVKVGAVPSHSRATSSSSKPSRQASTLKPRVQWGALVDAEVALPAAALSAHRAGLLRHR